MIDNDTLVIFLLAALVLLITPGPAVVYIVARSLSQGTLAGFIAALGMHVGTLVHVAAAAYGVSRLLMASALAFNIVKYLGAAYLIYLGVRSFLSKHEAGITKTQARRHLLTIFRESIVVNILNPKTALFFFAFLPQFVDTANELSVSMQIWAFGLIFILVGIVSDGLYAVFAGVLGDRFKRAGLHYGKYITGTVFTSLGVATALARR